jgi:hypothetical protein
MSLLAVAQIEELASLVYECVPVGSQMVGNLAELLLQAVEAKTRAKYSGNEFAGTFVKPTSDMLSLVKIQLPFMDECVKYVGCQSIKYAGGLFVPCGGKIKNSDFCNICSKKATEKGCHEFGTYEERKEALDNEELYTAGGKTEITYGDYLVAKKLTVEQVKQALRAGGLSINIPTRCLAVTGGAKKRSGRPSKKAEAAAENDETEVEAPKPKAPRVKMTLEEKVAKLKADEELKQQKAEQRATEKIAREAKKAEEEKAKAEARAAKLAKQATEDSGKKKKSKMTEAKVQEALAALESDNESDNESDVELGEPENSDEENVEEVYKLVTVKGITLQFCEANNKMYAESDTNRRFLIANWDTTQKAADFVGFDSDASRSILEEVFSNMVAKNDAKNKVLIGGKVHEINYANGNITRKGTIVKIFKNGTIQDKDDSDEEN